MFLETLEAKFVTEVSIPGNNYIRDIHLFCFTHYSIIMPLKYHLFENIMENEDIMENEAFALMEQMLHFP